MIGIKRYKAYWDHCLEEIAGINKVLLIVNEPQFGKFVANIKKAEYPVLVAVVPSADPASLDADNYGESNTGVIFILKKSAGANETEAKYLDDMEEMQGLMTSVKELMLHDKRECSSGYHDVMERLDVKSFHQDPEYNLLGHIGWSLSFGFETAGY
jgi:hypothetical protein